MVKKPASNQEHDFNDALKDIQAVGDIEPEMKIVLYGRAGTGKTTLAASFPKPILFLDFKERGTDSVRDVKGVFVKRVTTSQAVEDIYWAFMKGKALDPKTKKPYKTIVWDATSQLQQTVIKEVMEAKGETLSEGEVGNWGTMHKQDWGKVATRMRELIYNYRDLEGINVVFIAHDRVSGNDDEDTEEGRIEPSVGPAVSPSVAGALNAAVSIIGNTFIREKQVAIGKFKRGEAKKTKRVVKYCLRVGPHAAYITKIRKPKDIEVPAVIEDPSYDELLEYIEGEPSQQGE